MNEHYHEKNLNPFAYCTYVYQSSPFLKAIVNNNESEIYYLPSKR